jgi:hypothetical protein
VHLSIKSVQRPQFASCWRSRTASLLDFGVASKQKGIMHTCASLLSDLLYKEPAEAGHVSIGASPKALGGSAMCWLGLCLCCATRKTSIIIVSKPEIGL